MDIKYEKTVPTYGEYEVVVLGGGPAGVCAAIEAARMGAMLLLIFPPNKKGAELWN